MARENQGLQIALIVFVILTILFGVTAFLFHSSSTKAEAKAKSNGEAAQKAENGLREMTKDVEELKKLMGFAETDNMDRIRELSTGDMTKYASTYPEETRNYRGTLERMFESLREKNQLLDTELETVKKLKADNEARDGVVQKRIDTFAANAQQAEKDKQDELSKFNADRERMKSDADKLAEDLQASRKDKDTAVASQQVKIDDFDKKLKEKKSQLDVAVGTIREITNKDPKSFDGEIRWINQAAKTVWVNLGRADSLLSQTTFSIYPADAGDVSENSVKGSIEITQILGNHLAEGRILDDNLTDPIMPGDKINSPVWNPSEKLRFAIAGVIDMDGDGRDDTKKLYSIIEMNGGAVDAKLDEKGKRQGDMGINTRYLILGAEPEGKTADMLEDYGKMQGRAKELGVELISLDKLLNLMGWKKETNVLQYGGGAKGFEVPLDRTPRISDGKVSDLFKPRKPPKNNGGSTF